MTRRCPECSTELLPPYLACLACPWTRSRGPTDDTARVSVAVSPSFAVSVSQCVDVFQGQRCAAAGTLSMGTHGDGAWYCAKHFPPFAGRSYGPKPTGPAQGFQKLKDLLRHIATDAETAAERRAIQDERLSP